MRVRLRKGDDRRNGYTWSQQREYGNVERGMQDGRAQKHSQPRNAQSYVGDASEKATRRAQRDPRLRKDMQSTPRQARRTTKALR